MYSYKTIIKLIEKKIQLKKTSKWKQIKIT